MSLLASQQGFRLRPYILYTKANLSLERSTVNDSISNIPIRYSILFLTAAPGLGNRRNSHRRLRPQGPIPPDEIRSVSQLCIDTKGKDIAGVQFMHSG